MAKDVAKHDEADEAGEGAADDTAARADRKKKRLIIIAAAAVLVIGGVAGAWLTGAADPVIALVAGSGDHDSGAEAEQAAEAAVPVFYVLPDVVVNLNTRGSRPTYLKLRAELELTSADDIQRIEQRLPRITDSFQVYLRELRLDDIQGSAGTYRIREELLRRVSAAVAPAEVNDVLFAEMFIQ